MILDAITPKQPRLLVADLDGTLLHDAEVFEDRFITQRSISSIEESSMNMVISFHTDSRGAWPK